MSTTAPLSEIAIANFAIDVLDEAPLTSFSDNTPFGRFAAREYGYVRDEVYTLHPWADVKTRAILSPASDAPAFGYTYAYNLPADCLRLLPLREDGLYDGEPIVHEVESRQILTNYGPSLKVHYCRRETNAAKLSPLLARAIGARLALLACTRITGKASYYEKAKEGWSSAMFEAQHVDSLSRGTPESQYRNSVTAVRVPS